MPRHCRVSYVNEKLWYMYLKKWRQKPVTWTGWRSKCEKKQTLGSTTSKEKIKILTLTTESWSIVKAASYFCVSEYLIRQARELKKIHGILRKNRGKPLPASTAEKVQFFYEDDAHSRLMPGRKDFVTIKKNVHKQKRFLLCNLHELYVLFKEQNPVLKIGFFKFCSPRPKWCVTVGSTDTQSVCVYTIHQNATVLVNATKTGHTNKRLMKMTNLCGSQVRKMSWDTLSMWIPWNTLGWWLCIRSLFTTKKAVSLLRNYSLTIENMTLNFVSRCNAN